VSIPQPKDMIALQQPKPPQEPALELFQDERRYAGVELREANPTNRRQAGIK
jgi:hypothetical protein